MPAARRLALLQWARQNEALIIEDDYDGELRYDSYPLAALQGLDVDGRVVYLGTFSKVLFPALRLGYVVLPPALLGPFLQAKQLMDRGAPTLTQAAIADFMAEGYFEHHLRRLRETYGQRRRILLDALAVELGDMVQYDQNLAGGHLLVYLPEGVSEQAVIRGAAALSVAVYAGRPYHLTTQPRPSILLGFSGLSDTAVVEGVRRLAQAIKKETSTSY
jgi:GntR family transcriptional regulator/MocR family aminotransferase